MKDRAGKKVTTKEFFSRWKDGINQVTPLQQSKINFIGSVFMFIGVIIGIITTFILKTWWLFIILLGSFLLTAMAFLSNLQKYFAFKKINDQLKQMEENDNEQISTNGI